MSRMYVYRAHWRPNHTDNWQLDLLSFLQIQPANEMIVCDTVTSVIDLEIEKSKLWDSIWECLKLMRIGTWESVRMRKSRAEAEVGGCSSVTGGGGAVVTWNLGRLLKLGVNMRGQPQPIAAAGIKYFQLLTGNTNIWYSECVLQMWPEKISKYLVFIFVYLFIQDIYSKDWADMAHEHIFINNNTTVKKSYVREWKVTLIVAHKTWWLWPALEFLPNFPGGSTLFS